MHVTRPKSIFWPLINQIPTVINRSGFISMNGHEFVWFFRITSQQRIDTRLLILWCQAFEINSGNKIRSNKKVHLASRIHFWRTRSWKRGPIFGCLFLNRLNGSWIRSQKHSYGFLNNSNLYNDEWKRRFPPCNDILDKYLNLVHIHSSNSICRFSFDLNKTKIVLFQGFFNTIF